MAALNLASFQSPGVYVKEVPSQIKAITGVSTSTAGFIGLSVAASAEPTTVKTTDIFTASGTSKTFTLTKTPAKTDAGSFTVKQGSADISSTATIAKSTLSLATAPTKGSQISVEYDTATTPQAVLCTNFGEFKRAFPDFFDDTASNFSGDNSKNNLTNAVFGFFSNGGSRCFVINATDINQALDEFAKIDEIAVVAAPGNTDKAIQEALIDHCESQDGIFYRVAVLDGMPTGSDGNSIKQARNSNYAALYFPWLKVMDPKNPKNTVDAPPSGHIAGIYARVDNDRGVHKAPANETIRGALGVSQALSKPQQDGLNPDGINCIRVLNGNILVWGARTVGGDKNQDLKYINVRRTLLFLRKSIDQSTQWVVFEPNTPALWQKITRNVSAFLTTVWRSGALFGETPEEAFYVKCDQETNPPEAREAGAVVTEIGVAIARPAEFVVFQISQWAGLGQ
jgi:uncharacterized protein